MSKNPELVLLIDDDEDDNFFHQRAIRKSGLSCQIDVCTSGDDALDYLQNSGSYLSKGDAYPKPDLIFLDINMPRVNGWEFLTEYAKLCDTIYIKPRVIIVMLTTSVDSSTKECALATPLPKDFMSKPLNSEGITRIVSQYFPANSTA